MPESDPAYPILSAVLDIVPASHWTFARVDPKGVLDSLYGSHGSGKGLAGLADEFKRQRSKSPTGPRIAATLGSLDDFASGITLVFADARANFGILTLLRTVELGPFTSSEISMLTFALDAVSDRLSALRVQSPGQIAAQPAGSEATLPRRRLIARFTCWITIFRSCWPGARRINAGSPSQVFTRVSQSVFQSYWRRRCASSLPRGRQGPRNSPALHIRFRFWSSARSRCPARRGCSSVSGSIAFSNPIH